MLGHFPLHPLGHPNCPALRVRCVARSGGGTRKLGATHLKHREHLIPPVLCYSPVQTGIWGPCILVDLFVVLLTLALAIGSLNDRSHAPAWERVRQLSRGFWFLWC